MKRVFVFCLLGVLFAQANPVFAQKEQVVLQVWNRNGAIMGEAVKAFNVEMKSQGKNIRAEFTLVPYAEQSSKLIAALSAGKAPDVYALDDILGPYFSDQGVWVDLTSKVAALPFKADLNEGQLKLGEWSGKQYMLPWVQDNSAMVYNKTLLKKAGVQVPTTWAEALDAAKKISALGNGISGTTFAGGDSGMTMFTWLPFAWMNGAQLTSADSRTATIDSKQAAEALKFWQDLAKFAPKGAPNYQYGDWYNGFSTGKVGFLFGGSWHVQALQNDNPDLDFGVAPLPVPSKGKNTATFAGGDILGITTQSKHQEEAWVFVQFLLSEKVQADIVAQNGSVPVRQSVADKNKYFEKEPRYKVFAYVAKYGVAPKAVNYNAITSIMSTIIPKVLSNEMTPEAALKSVNPEIQKVLK